MMYALLQVAVRNVQCARKNSVLSENDALLFAFVSKTQFGHDFATVKQFQ